MKLILGLLTVVIAASPALSAPLIQVTPALSANGVGSPSYAQWEVNAISALYAGASTQGTAGTPTYYSQSPSVLDVSENFVTSFSSWNGVANPGGAFANEHGNRLLFGLTINGGGEKFSISQLSFVMDSTDPTDSLDFSYGAGGYNYGAGYQGILFGADNSWGGGDDTFITSGLNTQLVDGLVGRGSGNAWWPGDGPVPPGTEQAAIDALAASLGSLDPFQFTGTYTLHRGNNGPATGSASVTFNAASNVPEGSTTLALLTISLVGLAAMRARRR